MAYLCIFRGSLSTIPPNLFLSSIRPGQEMLLSLDYLPVWLILEYQQIPDSLNESLYKLRICGALATTAKGAMTALPRQHDLPSQ